MHLYTHGLLGVIYNRSHEEIFLDIINSPRDSCIYHSSFFCIIICSSLSLILVLAR